MVKKEKLHSFGWVIWKWYNSNITFMLAFMRIVLKPTWTLRSISSHIILLWTKLNYARYGSYYLHQMKNREVIYLGLKVLVSVEGQDRYNIRTPIDQRGVKTLNKLRRTVRGIKGFTANTNAVAKWTLNQSYQAENLSCLHKLSNLTTASYILRSEDIVFKVINTFKNYYKSKNYSITTFDPFLEKETLYNPSSGAAMSAEVTGNLLLVHEKGQDLCEDFLQAPRFSTTKKGFTIRSQEITTKWFWQKNFFPLHVAIKNPTT